MNTELDALAAAANYERARRKEAELQLVVKTDDLEEAVTALRKIAAAARCYMARQWALRCLETIGRDA